MGLTVVDLTRARHRAAYGAPCRLTALAASDHPAFAPIARCWAGFAPPPRSASSGARGASSRPGVADGGDPGLPGTSVPRMLRSQLALVGRPSQATPRPPAGRHGGAALRIAHGAASERAHADACSRPSAAIVLPRYGGRRRGAAEAVALRQR